MRAEVLTATEFFKLFRFAVVGVLATIVHMGVAWLADQAGLDPVMASITGFLPAAAVSYLGHYYFSFRSASSHKVALLRFIALSVGSFSISLLILSALEQVAPQAALLVSIAFIPAINFVISRLFVFRH